MVKYKEIGLLMAWTLVGAILGATLTLGVGAIWGIIYGFIQFHYSIVFFAMPTFWLLSIIWGTVGSISWIPLGAVIGAVIALYTLAASRDVSRVLLHSTGIVLIALGLMLVIAKWTPSDNPDHTAITIRYTTFNESFNTGNFEEAYLLMSPTYRQAYAIEDFKRDFSFLGDLDGYPLHPNHSLRFASDNRAYLYPNDGWTIAILWSGPEFELEKIDREWYFTGEYTLYLD